MDTWKPVSLKGNAKKDREIKVLLGLVEYFIQTGKAVGSSALKEAGFEALSSATIRNYFANLEKSGYLTQSHSSGGRIPTPAAFRLYAETFLDENEKVKENVFDSFKQFESREVALFLQETAESLCQATGCAVFLSAPRFDHDFVLEIKLVSLDAYRCVCILITDFGVIKTEILHLPEKLSSSAIKRLENYFHYRLTGLDKPQDLKPDEEKIGQNFYNELMLRYIIGYSNFADEDIYRTGFSKLLAFPDFIETRALAHALSLFENVQGMRLLLKECSALNRLKFWIGNDLDTYVQGSNSSVLAIPYYINHKPVGAVGLLGPIRIPYRRLFGILRLFSESLSQTLTNNIYKYKIHFRRPESGNIYLEPEESRLIGQSQVVLLEDKGEMK